MKKGEPNDSASATICSDAVRPAATAAPKPGAITRPICARDVTSQRSTAPAVSSVPTTSKYPERSKRLTRSRLVALRSWSTSTVGTSRTSVLTAKPKTVICTTGATKMTGIILRSRRICRNSLTMTRHRTRTLQASRRASRSDARAVTTRP